MTTTTTMRKVTTMKLGRSSNNYLTMDLGDVGEKIEKSFQEAGMAIEIVATSKVVGDCIPAAGVAIDRLLDCVRLLSDLQGAIAYEGSGEVERMREELNALSRGDAPKPTGFRAPLPGNVVFAPYDGNMH